MNEPKHDLPLNLEWNQSLYLRIPETGEDLFDRQGLSLGYNAFRIVDISERIHPLTALVRLPTQDKKNPSPDEIKRGIC
jgi:hypothetical protein